MIDCDSNYLTPSQTMTRLTSTTSLEKIVTIMKMMIMMTTEAGEMT